MNRVFSLAKKGYFGIPDFKKEPLGGLFTLLVT
jgi:hypothetical protein